MTCVAGLCSRPSAADAGEIECASAADCDDAIPCTVDFCDVTRLCAHFPQHAECDDGIDCTVDSCSTGVGCVNSPVDTDCPSGDESPCAVARCEVGTGCVVSADASLCDDGVGCTVDGCDPHVGCSHAPDSGRCTSGTSGVCTATGCQYDSCDAGSCASTACTIRRCAGTVCEETAADCHDDANPCTRTVCMEPGGCTQMQLTGASCDDGDPCTVGDRCSNGMCAGDPMPCPPCQSCASGGGSCAPDTDLDGTTCGARDASTDPVCCAGACVNLLQTSHCGMCDGLCRGAACIVDDVGAALCSCGSDLECPFGTVCSTGRCQCQNDFSCPTGRRCLPGSTGIMACR